MKKILSLALSLSLLTACQNPGPKNTDQANSDSTQVADNQNIDEQDDWLNGANIYEVNIRQYTPEGTIQAFSEHLDRLQELGVKILWMMPIQPIGEKNRKGGLGSYYSIKDYTAVNPNFGSLEDFKAMVEMAHDRDMKVILDWVANHTAWDHHWIEEHPDWYTQNEAGEIIAPVEDWSDVADLNYNNPSMRDAMREAMGFWLKEANIDGFRCDVAMMVPMEFWNKTRDYLDSIKPVFMLAEAEGTEFHAKAFDMTYGWEPHHIMNEMAKGEMGFADMVEYLEKQEQYPADAMRMYFTTNHDENSWNGTIEERMGANGLNYFVMATTLPKTMPLIYSGQEVGLNKRLAFFEKDTIDWSDKSLQAFYQKMLRIKAEHPCLKNGAEQASFETGEISDDLIVYSRKKGDHELIVYLNMTDNNLEISDQGLDRSKYQVLAPEASTSLEPTQKLAAHSYLLISTKY